MGGSIADQPVIDTRGLFRPEREALLGVLETLTAEQWQLPTVCEGWSAHDVALHLVWGDISNLSRRRDDYFGRAEDDPGDLSDLPALIAFVNQLNDNWIVGARRMSPRLLQTLLRVTGDEWAEWVNGVDITAMGPGIGWAGPDPAPVWLDIAREFTERWVHQQHIRDAVGIPGAAEPRFLKPVLGTFAMALPFALRDVHAAEGTTARLEITGESGGVWTAVRRGDRWVFAADRDGAPAGSVRLDQENAWRLFTRGIPADRAVQLATVSGDDAIIQAIFGMVTILA
jgi:uncharacterized protein (TIGR03083 family)